MSRILTKYVNYPSYEAKNKDATGKLLSTVISIKVVNKYDMLSTLTLARNHLGQEYVLKKSFISWFTLK